VELGSLLHAHVMGCRPLHLHAHHACHQALPQAPPSVCSLLPPAPQGKSFESMHARLLALEQQLQAAQQQNQSLMGANDELSGQLQDTLDTAAKVGCGAGGLHLGSFESAPPSLLDIAPLGISTSEHATGLKRGPKLVGLHTRFGVDRARSKF